MLLAPTNLKRDTSVFFSFSFFLWPYHTNHIILKLLLLLFLGFDRATRSPGSILSFLNQNDVILVKKHKSQRVATGFLTGSCRINPPGFFFLYFFFNSARFQPWSTCQAGPSFKTILQI
jgi:hypothetical protein